MACIKAKEVKEFQLSRIDPSMPCRWSHLSSYAYKMEHFQESDAGEYTYTLRFEKQDDITGYLILNSTGNPYHLNTIIGLHLGFYMVTFFLLCLS